MAVIFSEMDTISALKASGSLVLLGILLLYPDFFAKAVSLFFLLHIAWNQVAE